MNDDTPELRWDSLGKNGTVRVMCRIGDETVIAEKCDVLRPKQRDALAERIGQRFPDWPIENIQRALLQIAGEVASGPKAPAAGDEADELRLVRPELFHHPAVSGILIPTVTVGIDGLIGQWRWYLRWADGRREVRAFSPTIDLPDGARLFAHPKPTPPSPTMPAGWTADARRDWLADAPAPDPADVFSRLCETFARFLDFPPETAAGTTATLALWVMFTYVFPAWRAAPYLSLGGPLGSGKSTVFGVLSQVVFRPLPSSSMTGPCLFRTLSERGGVLLLDEAERLKDQTPDAAELRPILLSGYKRGSPASRLEKQGDAFVRVEFDVFGPKALASIANLPEALQSRCIKLMMFRAAPDSPKPRRRLDDAAEDFARLRDDLHALALEHGPTWAKLARRSDVVPVELGGRDYELSQPLLTLAAWLDEAGAGGLLSMMQDHARDVIDESHEASVPETDETLLQVVAEAVREGRQSLLKAGDVLRRANEINPAAFSKWTAKGVANALGRYGVRTSKGRGSTGRTYSKVSLPLLARIESAYGFSLGLPDPAHVPTCTDTYRQPAF